MSWRIGRFLGWCWRIAAVAVILLAIVATAGRLLLPRLDRERPQVEAWVSKWVGASVSIGSLATGWQRGLPLVTARDISVRLPDGHGPEVLRFALADAGLDVWGSLRAGQLQPGHLTLRGLSRKLSRLADGTFAVEGFPVHDAHFTRWLLAQRALAVVDASFTLRDTRSRFRPVTADGVDFTLTGDGHTTRISGVA